MKPFQIIILLAMLYLLSGCASMISSATQKMADNLSTAMLNQNDPLIVKAAAPAYLVMLDSLVEGDPENVSTLLSASRLYGSYTSAFVEEPERATLLAEKSLSYARTALCLELENICHKLDAPLDEFQPELERVNRKQLPILYDFASAWAGWIQHNSSDWNAIAQIPKLTAIFNRSLQLDEAHDRGGAHLYLGILHSQLPPSVGGKPERGRSHFEKAQTLSKGKNLMVDVLFAESYARLVFDQELHDRLLRSVLSNKNDEPGLTLINTLARQRATELLAESNDFF